MKLLAVSLSFNIATTDVLGSIHYQSDDGELVPVMVRRQVQPPGWRLVDLDGAPLTDPTDPATVEADRLMRVLTIPAAEVARREQAVRAVIHSAYLSGFKDDLEFQRQQFRFARGELTLDELHTWTQHATTTRQEHQAAESAPTPTMPDEWWDAVHTRFNRMLSDMSVPPTEAAAMLGYDGVDEVNYLLGENRLVSYDVNGDERIPLWQLHDPDAADGRFVLLPGLDVVIAAAPEELQAPERLSFFMASLHPTLHVDGLPTTPYRWLAAGEALRTIVALLNGRRW
jgi:hypothetical protein